MSLPDSTAITALGAMVIKPVFFAFLDFVGAPVYVNSSGADVTPSGMADADLNNLFSGVSGDFIDISPVRYAMGGSDSVIATLSGIPSVDDDTLAMLADPANWRGRDARLWRVIRDAANVQQGGFHAFYTGKMTNVTHLGSPGGTQTIRVTIESYLAAFSQASNRTYLDQERYDPTDLSAKAAVAIANGNFTQAVAPAPTPSPSWWEPWG